ncbi:cupin [Nodularia spumigena CS-584]|jgi:predicted metal-dependent enzyme (double-stranded beta helix superfamily)|uniref:Cupin n=1 Tax=Nodularia spumigena UHCC 0060 TaxID=3110300 RepID=A0ABU5UNM3_NODSP|nr:cupin [Nodularia spumigena]AHJ28707.1 Cupin region protein [Nodularia spumigena CCY9414]EAW46287.1 Cupin region protein [Nodularia spumigena CCY9414]MDB9382467.1 cupin [Nodularia spumigena CS-584]MEA5525092.1 cupin [Nodularia spumigena UHCC 0143]MEA5555117.1 cupin [Nodularia spumigena CH309]
MLSQDWLVTDDGKCEAWEESADNLELWTGQYRLYRFLTDLENILHNLKSDRLRLQAIFPLVRRLLTSSEWLQGEYLEPNPETGWSVLTLYDEPDFPLTVQTVAWLSGRVSPIHNHATWGVVALISGEEKNTLWRRTDQNGSIEKSGDVILTPGEIIGLMPDAIHHVEALGDEPTISFNLYGETNYEQRFEFNPVTGTVKIF